MNAFIKMKNGKWGLRIDGALPKAGDLVQVTKRNGDIKLCNIGEVLWHGIAKNGVESSLCSIGAKAPRAPRRWTQGPPLDDETIDTRNLGCIDPADASGAAHYMADE